MQIIFFKRETTFRYRYFLNILGAFNGGADHVCSVAEL